MLWIPLAIASYFFSALSQTIDKILLSARIPSATTYAFYTGLTSILVIVLIPFGFGFLPPPTLLLALLTGIVFITAIYFLYTSLARCDVSRIVPMIGGAIPIFLLMFSSLFFQEVLHRHDILAIAFFLAGGLILATEVYPHTNTNFGVGVKQDGGADSLVRHLLGTKGKRLQICRGDSRTGIGAALFSAFFFALTFFLSKEVYNAPTPFIPEFFWMRMGSVVGALLMLGLPTFRREIFLTSPQLSRSSIGMLFGNKIIGASSFLLLNLSFDLAPSQAQVVVINAMKGVEHLFVFLFSVALTVLYPKILRESFDYHTILLKLAGIALIAVGFLYLQ